MILARTTAEIVGPLKITDALENGRIDVRGDYLTWNIYKVRFTLPLVRRTQRVLLLPSRCTWYTQNYEELKVIFFPEEKSLHPTTARLARRKFM